MRRGRATNCTAIAGQPISALAGSRRFCFWLITTIALALAATPRARAHADLLALIETMTKRIEGAPTNAELYLLRGELYRAHSDWKLAEADYDQAVALAPQLASVTLARGKLLFESGRASEAKTALDKYLQMNPDDIDGLLTRAQLLARLGERQSAAADYTRAIQHSPAPRADFFLDRAKVQAEAGELTQALAGLDEGLQRLGPLMALQISALDLECTRRNFESALRRLQAVTDVSERKEKWLVRRGEILLLANRPDEARAAFAAASEAIASLPPRLRVSPAMVDLQQRISQASNHPNSHD